MPLPARLQVVQNDIISPLEARMKQTGEPYPFGLRLKQMWKPYGLQELFERVIPAQTHENDGLIFTPVQDPYVAGTCHRLLKWKPSELNTIDFLINWNVGRKAFELFIATQGRPHFYLEFDPLQDVTLLAAVGKTSKSSPQDLISEIADKVAEFNYDSEKNWKFLRFRPDKRLPNDSKTVEKVIHSISDNVTKEDLQSRQEFIRKNWKAREAGLSSGPAAATSPWKLPAESTEPQRLDLKPRSQMSSPTPFDYPLKLSKLSAVAWNESIAEAEQNPKKKTKTAEKPAQKTFEYDSSEPLNYDLPDE